MATTLSQSSDAAPGTYKITYPAPQERTVHVGCPQCSRVVHLRNVHITPDGDVRPTFLCDCGFNDDLVLGGWGSLRAEVPTVQRRGTNPTAR